MLINKIVLIKVLTPVWVSGATESRIKYILNLEINAGGLKVDNHHI